MPQQAIRLFHNTSGKITNNNKYSTQKKKKKTSKQLVWLDHRQASSKSYCVNSQTKFREKRERRRRRKKKVTDNPNLTIIHRANNNRSLFFSLSLSLETELGVCFFYSVLFDGQRFCNFSRKQYIQQLDRQTESHLNRCETCANDVLSHDCKRAYNRFLARCH